MMENFKMDMKMYIKICQGIGNLNCSQFEIMFTLVVGVKIRRTIRITFFLFKTSCQNNKNESTSGHNEIPSILTAIISPNTSPCMSTMSEAVHWHASFCMSFM